MCHIKQLNKMETDLSIIILAFIVLFLNTMIDRILNSLLDRASQVGQLSVYLLYCFKTFSVVLVLIYLIRLK